MTLTTFKFNLRTLSLENLYRLLEIATPGEQANAVREELHSRFQLAKNLKRGVSV
jgi:hypothetical protein